MADNKESTSHNRRSGIADRVEPVPEDVVPLALRNNSAGLSLFKEEFRAAQRLRSTEGIFIPEVLRTTHPPEAAPHDVASHPAPTYVLNSHLQRPAARNKLGPGYLNQPSLQRKPSPSKARGHDWSDSFLNTPNQDYMLSRQPRPDAIPARPMSPAALPACPASPTGGNGHRPTSALNASLADRMMNSSRPMTSNTLSPPMAGAVGSLINTQTMSNTKALLASQVLTPPHTATSTSSRTSASQRTIATPPSSWPAGPTQLTITPYNTSPSRPLTPSSALRSVSEQVDIVTWDDADRMQGEPASRPTRAAVPGKFAAGMIDSASLLARLPTPLSLQSQPGQAGYVTVRPTEQLSDSVTRVRAASASLRRYNMPPAPTAASTTATIFARKPKAPYKMDPRQATSSERIANNYSPLARGLSPRTLEVFMPGGIKPGALGPLPPVVWNEVDELDAQLGVPEADGVITAARKHLAFMPLELFDNWDYETHSPQEWVTMGEKTGGTPAETVMYQVGSDEYQWAPCRVTGWDEGARMYEVVFGEDGSTPVTRQDSNGTFTTYGAPPLSGGLKKKLVKRLNLRFKAEDPIRFERRVADAKASREAAESDLRTTFYLDAMRRDVQEVLMTYDFNAALGTAANQVKELSSNVLEAVGHVLLEDAADYYERAVKLAILNYRRMDPMEESRLKVLRLPAPHMPGPAPDNALLFTTLPVEPKEGQEDNSYGDVQYAARLHTYPELAAWANSHLFAAQPVLLEALANIESVAAAIIAQPLWCLAGQTPEFKLMAGGGMYELSEAGKPPFPLARFEALQHSHLRQVVSFINMKLVQALNVTEDAQLAKLLNNGQAYDDPYNKSEAHMNLLRFVRTRMADAVHEVLRHSAQLYANCLESYQVPPCTTSVKTECSFSGIQEVFSAGAFLRVGVQEAKIVAEKAAAKRAAEDRARALLRSETNTSTASAVNKDKAPEATKEAASETAVIAVTPLQDETAAAAQTDANAETAKPNEAAIEQKQKYIVVVPTPDEITDVAAGMFSDMFDSVSELQDCYVSTTLEAELLCDFSAWKDDIQLSASRKRVSDMVAIGIERAQEVASMFEDAAAALDVDLAQLLAQLSVPDTSLNDYSTYISRFRSAATAAVAATPTEVWTGLLLVDTAPLKASLTANAEAMIDALLNQLLDKSKQAYHHVCVRCETISFEVMADAEDTKGVLDLRAKLTAAQDECEVLKEQIDAAREWDAFRIAYRHERSLDDSFNMLSLRAQCWPKDLQDVFVRAWRKIDQEHYRFQDALKLRRQSLKEELGAASQAVAAYRDIVDATELAENAHAGRQLTDTLQSLSDKAQDVNAEEALFGWDKTEWPQINELTKELEPYAAMWHVVSEFTLKSDDWMFGNMQSLNAELLDEQVNEWFKRMQRLSKSLPLQQHRQLADSTRAKLEEFKTYLPVIQVVCNPGMRGRHWDQLSQAVGSKIWPGEDLQLQRLIKLNILDHMQALQDISDAASREHSLERQLDKMQGEWSGVCLELVAWKDTGGFILKGSSVEEAQLLLDDHTIKSQAMQSSPAAAAFIDRIEAWVKKLGNMQDIFDAWLTAQSKWMWLRPVYGSEEIAKQLPRERKEFAAADAKWRSIMQGVQRQPEILQVTDTEHLLTDLTACNNSFDVVEKSLNAYLDSKKLLFPRFFFLSNDELIEILSEAKDPANVQPFVKKIFEAVSHFDFNGNMDIIAMTSIEAERIPFDSPVETGGEFNGVERWLLKAEEMMRRSLATIMHSALQAYPTKPRDQWILEWPGQIVIAVGQTYWTRAATEAITQGAAFGLNQLLEKNTAELLEEVRLVRGDLTALQRATIGALVVVDVHARDVVSDMVQDQVSSIDDFSWQSRLRYYWENGNMLVRMLNAECIYGYEYLGNSGRLVITPLTDRCYRTLLGAHHLNLGGAPAGPAGTGKTETTKDLAKAVAIQCVVFNCSDGLDYIAMGKFFKGLAASGAWACFDEFNRIELEVLSVVAQQVLTIQRAKAAGKKRFVFEGVELPLIHTCNVFITMNPGYAGRSELPDNLKALFRDVAMMVPDYAMIAEIILYSYGYTDARSLAGKLVQTYRLCSEQLSRQEHYDYGMRAVMAVLRAAGNLKRKLPDEREDVLMLRAITDVNLPKFLDEDVPLFRGILSDLFPGVELPELDYTHLTAALACNAEKQGLQPLPTFIEKAIQLYEMIVVRHGLMLVGQSFGMKTSAIRVLAAALGDMCAAGQGEHKVKVTTLNPKAVTLGQLYGQDDPVSKEWTDGVLAVAFRTAARDTSPDRKWLVLDGPVDAIWIENMNTVLDDNKKLCLNSGEIIAMQGLMNMIFEVADLAVASPATVSRCGMVYVQPSLLGWKPLVASWMARLPDAAITAKHRETMNNMFESLLPPLLRLVTKDCKQPVVMQDLNLVQSLLNLYEALLQPLLPPSTQPQGAAVSTQVTDPLALVESSLVFALVWSVGATVDGQGRELFNTHLRNFLKGEFGDYSSWLSDPAIKPPPLKKPLPSDGSVYDWVFDTASCSWKQWMDTVPTQKISPEAEYSQIIVQTVDVVRVTFLLSTLLQSHHHTLLVGPTGTGKTAYIKGYLNDGLDRKAWATVAFNFSAQTSANVTQDIVDGRLDKRRKGVYGPPVGKHAIVFIDDLNMPQVEKYGAQPPIELLRQYMDHGGWYDRTDNSFRKLIDVQLLAAMGPPGGGRNSITNRFSRHFNVLHVNEFDDNSKTQIFSALVNWWFTRCNFHEEFKALKNGLVAASLAVYSTVVSELLPTPTKTHYLFNLRDLSKVFQGLSAAGADVMAEPAKMVRLWIHEMMRVFHDRLVDDADRSWLCDKVLGQVQEHFRMKPAQILARFVSDNGNLGAAELRTLLWADFMIPGADPQKYDEIASTSRMSEVVMEYLNDYNAASKKPLNLVLFQFALEHIARIARILKQPGGHALLVGVGGSGRQSLTQLAAFIEDYTVFSVEISASYTISGPNNNWHDDLKKALRHAGEKRKPSVFLFSDAQIIDEAMVEDISNLLGTGEVPNLFDTGELLAIGEAIRPRARAVQMDGSRADLYAFFVQEVRRNLHVVLCFSPVGAAFRERLRKFPSLVTCTTIDWFSVWPDDALRSVALQSVRSLELEDDLAARIADQCMRFHRSARELSARFLKDMKRHFYVTPTSYLQLLDSFNTLLQRKREEVTSAQRRYEVGLDKLASTEGQVQGMQAELEALAPQLAASSTETEQLMVVITQQTAEADAVKAVVQADEATAKEEAAKVQAIKEECEADLAEALPAYNAALKALDTLTKNDISEVKGMKAPPAPVRLVMEAVCILKGLKPTKVKDTNTGKFVNDWWETSKKMLSDMGFLDSLRTYDKDNIDPDIIEALKPLLKQSDFQPEKIRKVSQAAYGLCNWVRAMDTYDRVAKVVKPKREKLAESMVALSAVQRALAAKQAELAQVEGKLVELSKLLSTAKARKDQLQADVALCEEKLDRASKLIGGLGGEKVRWTDAAAELAAQFERLTGDMLLASGVIAYLGAFPGNLRQETVHTWVKELADNSIPCSASFSFTNALGDPVQMRQWAIWGLPRDDVSAANAIIVHQSKRWPLCIDPQGQANKWIRGMEAARKLVVLKPSTDSNYLRALQAALPLGTPVLLEGLGESLDASLEPVLLRQTFKQAGVLCVKLGDGVVEWSPDFRLYMTTKLRNPHYPPEVCTRVSLLNFCITKIGLEDQLLGVVVARERPDLEEDKARLIVQGAENARRLKEIENEILRVLSSSEGNILDDGEAVDILQASKKLSDEIAVKQKDAGRTEMAIDKARTGYAPIAAHASTLFFCVAELANIDPMYQYSLAYFMSLFVRSIEESTKSTQLAKRLETLQEHFTFFLFTNVCRSLFEKDKLLFAFSLATAVGVAQGRVAPGQLRFLLTGALSMDNPHPNPASEWLSDQAWSNVCDLDSLDPAFSGIRASLQAYAAGWLEYYDCASPHTQPLPAGYGADLDAFQKLLVLRSIVPDKLVHAIQAYVSSVLGARYVEPQTFRLDSVFTDSAAAVPLIFVLSFGSDPMTELLRFAEERHKQVETVSLGQGQGPIAEKWIDQAVKEGFWVVLQNCHLARSFLPRLEVICEKTLGGESGAVHPEFRLWLTSYPSEDFPQSILENGLKITNEPPKGLRAGLQRIMKSDPITDDTFFSGCASDGAFKNLMLGLAFFHCVVVGRKLYGPVGWNIPYTFNNNDLHISLRQLRMFLDEAVAAGSEPPLAMLTYTAGECNYGGKVTDAKDRRTLMVLLNRFYNEDAVLGGADLAPGAAAQGSAHSQYCCPHPGDHASYLTWIQNLPQQELPQVFGLHPNALITRNLQDTKQLLDTLLLTHTQDGAGGGASQAMSPEDMLYTAAGDILDKLPADFDLEAAQARYPVTYEESMNTVLVQELGRANVLLQVIRSSLRELRKAVRGLVVMSSSLEQVGAALMSGKVPEVWLSRSFPSLKPLGPYVREVIERCEFFSGWLANGPPTVFWISGFFFTQAFLTGAKQNYARRHTVPIDLIEFNFSVKDRPGDCSSKPQDGVYVRGLFIEAAAWDSEEHCLCESAPKVLFAQLPPLHFLPARTDDMTNDPHYLCPVYKTSERRGVLSTTGHSTNYVCDLKLPSKQPQEHWVMRGTAVLTSLDA